MTCVAVRVTPRGSLWAWDSAVTLGNGALIVDTSPKVVDIPPWGLVGGAGDCRTLALGYDLWAHHVVLGRVLDRLREAAPEDEAEWLLVFDGMPVRVYSGGHAVRPARTYDAIGSGAEVALGALGAGASVRRAVGIAVENRSDCRGPIKEAKR